MALSDLLKQIEDKNNAVIKFWDDAGDEDIPAAKRQEVITLNKEIEIQGLEVQAAWHFDRMTPLEEGGIRDWLATFGGILLHAVPKPERSAIIGQIEEMLRPKLYRDNRWHMDYVRIRIKAEKRCGLPG